MRNIALVAAGSEVIPDSEEECMRSRNQCKLKMPVILHAEIIEVSSDEDSNEGLPEGVDRKPAPKAGKQFPVTPKGRKIRYIHTHDPIEILSSDSEADLPRISTVAEDPLLHSPVKASHAVIDLTLDEDDEDDDDQETSSEEDAGTAQRDKTNIVVQTPKPRPKPRPLIKALPRFPQNQSNRFVDPWDEDDGSILTMNEPKSASRPIKQKQTPRHAFPDVHLDVGEVAKDWESPFTLGGPSQLFKDHDHRRTTGPLPSALSSSETRLEISPTKGSKAQTTKTKAPRMTKKVVQAIEQARRETYAQQLFDDLNTAIFKGGLPTDTALRWSNRLLTTAGRAKWKRSRDGSQTSEIELATKILDCDERIKNTLSHEMCHLACWIIDGDPKEGHGKAFKSWAAKIMRRRSDIEVTTRHNYEINYPYEWECENCAKIYGRYSKSIKPEECRCGACKTGKLVPLFKVRAPPQTPRKKKADSKLADPASSDLPQVVDVVTNALSGLALDSGSQNSAVCIEAQLAALTEELGGVGLLA